MADQHPYRHDPNGDAEDEEDDQEEEVVFKPPGKSGSLRSQDRSLATEEKTYPLHDVSGDPEAAPCGLLCLRFPSLSRYATLNMFIVLVTLLCCFQGTSTIKLLYCPAMFGHFSPAPVKTDRVVRIQ